MSRVANFDTEIKNPDIEVKGYQEEVSRKVSGDREYMSPPRWA